jgi:hypothetical protein
MDTTNSLVRIGAACALVAVLGTSGFARAQTRQVETNIDSTRPVADSVRVLIKQHPVVITYEDPRYEYQGDLKDVTALARSPENAGKPGAVLVPKGGTLATRYEVSTATEEPVDYRNALEGILDAQTVSQNGGRFRVLQSGGVFHVVPAEVRYSKGVWTRQSSILDTRITLPSKELNGYEMLRAITNAVSEATGIYVGLGTMNANQFFKFTGSIEATDEPARDVLMRVLQSISHRLTWRLFYGPDVKQYALNITVVAEPKSNSTEPGIVPLPDTGPSPTRRAPLTT